MRPLPGSPGASWASYRASIVEFATGHALRTFAAFWLLGLVNNVLYVIILSAAVDLVGAQVPVGLVLLADVLPSFVTKLVVPYWIQRVPYGVRVITFVILSVSGMLLIAVSPDAHSAGTIAVKLLGVVVASISSGGGELSFLGLTHYYPNISLAAWGSGTGGAGLVGAGAYVLATTVLGLSSRMAMVVFSFLPILMLVSYFLVLPPKPLSQGRYQSVPGSSRSESPTDDGTASAHNTAEHQGLLDEGAAAGQLPAPTLSDLTKNVKRVRKLLVPYMLPLFLVYVAEYTINQGVAPTLLFPLRETPFRHYREFYPTYNAIYQAGVFVSRSSIAFFRIPQLYTPTILQVVNLFLLTSHVLFGILGNIWVVFAVMFWEGLLGGLVYVSTFAAIREGVPVDEREFSLSAATVSDSGGICIAALLSMGLQTYLCNWQVARGRDYCRMRN